MLHKRYFALLIIRFANVQSLENKMDELHARTSTQKDIQDFSILCFCETWQGERTPDEAVIKGRYTVESGLVEEERPHSYSF